MFKFYDYVSGGYHIDNLYFYAKIFEFDTKTKTRLYQERKLRLFKTRSDYDKCNTLMLTMTLMKGAD